MRPIKPGDFVWVRRTRMSRNLTRVYICEPQQQSLATTTVPWLNVSHFAESYRLITWCLDEEGGLAAFKVSMALAT